MFRHVVRLLILPLLILLTMYAGDALLMARPAAVSRLMWAFVDPPVHAVLALLIASPLLIQLPSLSTEKSKSTLGGVSLLATLIVVASATLIDIDHFIAARSFTLDAALNLPMRPASHSLSFAFAALCLILLVTRRLDLSYLIFAALASHVLRDASGGGTPLFWPLPVYSLAWPMAVSGLILLYLGSWLIANLQRDERKGAPERRTSKSHAADKMSSVIAPTDASLEITRKPW